MLAMDPLYYVAMGVVGGRGSNDVGVGPYWASVGGQMMLAWESLGVGGQMMLARESLQFRSPNHVDNRPVVL